MNFTISNEGFTFHVQVDGNGHLTSFTATKDSVTFDCSIQLQSRANPLEIFCCNPSGCTSGPCLP